MLLIVINQAAAKARKVWPMIQQQLEAGSVAFRLYETACAGDATRETRRALLNGVTTIAVVGGDGTLSEVAEGFFEFNADLDLAPKQVNAAATLAALPAGTGDDFARGLRNGRAPLHEWVEQLIALTRGEVEPTSIDALYGRCNNLERPFICLNGATMGIGGETAGRVAAQGNFMRHFSGEFRFIVAALGALAAWRERRVRVTLDDVVVADGPMNLVAVLNGLYAGGGMMLSPQARVGDGKLDVVTVTEMSRVNIMHELTRVHNGGHVKNPKVTLKQGKLVKIETFLEKDALPLEADGNVRGVTPVQFQILTGGLQFLI